MSNLSENKLLVDMTRYLTSVLEEIIGVQDWRLNMDSSKQGNGKILKP
jgi:hypothetical protein